MTEKVTLFQNLIIALYVLSIKQLSVFATIKSNDYSIVLKRPYEGEQRIHCLQISTSFKVAVKWSAHAPNCATYILYDTIILAHVLQNCTCK